MDAYCCTCAAPLTAAGSLSTLAIPASPMTTPTKTDFHEKTASLPHRQLPCCDRFVCSCCLTVSQIPPDPCSLSPCPTDINA